ncbi:hypothetical protein MHU86_19349 [Fragilaria crotonensis]|nr:hypothetical protein MHU86_19349 [Fragilaria crotonensis]
MVDRHEPSKIAEWALDGIQPTDFAANPTWPRQQTPTLKQQRLWRRYIASQFIRYGRAWIVAPQRTLKDLKVQISKESTQQQDAAQTLPSRLKRLPRNKRRLLSHINFTSDEDTLWKECQRKQILTIASDGGLKGRKGTIGWSVTTPKNDILCEGAGPIDGPYDTASSTRCELSGYAAALLFLSLLATPTLGTAS